uniref:Dynein axonemal heavy chain 14 n=1 Tax=Anolis carolinensis TaxID=28377 RepID=A0A803T4L4_ANOCA
MNEKIRQQQKLLTSRLQHKPDDTNVPHMVKGKFLKHEEASRIAGDEHPLLFPADISSDLRTAVCRTNTARKRKEKNKEGELGFEYVFSRIYKERTKPVVDHANEVAEWNEQKILEYSNLKSKSTEKLSITPLYEDSSCTVDTFAECEAQEKIEVQTVSSQLSCHRRTCMKFQAGYNHKFVRKKSPPSYDKTEPIIDDVISHILRLRDKLGWETSLPRCGFIANEDGRTDKQKITLPSVSLQKDDGEYVYCLIRSRDDPKAAYDPYDLQVVSANLARQFKEYWTITASYISKFTLVCGEEKMEIRPVIEWLYERQLYYALRSIKICFNFRKIKYFIVWKSNVRRSKVKKSKMVIYKQLFFVDEILQNCLLYIQALCVDVSSPKRNKSSEDVAIHFIKIDTSYTYTLNEFCEKQYQQSQLARSLIQTFRDKVIKVIQRSFLKVAEMKGAEKLFQHFPDDVTEKSKHFEIAEWRHIMERFSRFLQLVDRIFQELLRRLVHNAIDHLLEIFKGSSMMVAPKEKTNEKLIRLFKKTIERADDLLLSEIRCPWMHQNNYFQEPQELPCPPKEHEVQQDIITTSDIDKILEEVKRLLKGEAEYSPIFEVNLCLRIPYEKDFYRTYYPDDEDLTETPLESVKEELEYSEDFKNLAQHDSKIKFEQQLEDTITNASHSGKKKNYNVLDQESIAESSNGSIIYESSPLFSTDVYLTPNRREFSVQLQGILDGLENTIAMEAKNTHLVEITRTALAKLSKELTTVDGFIEHLQYLQEISTDLPKINTQYNSLSELYYIAKDYDIFLPIQQLALYQTIVRTLQNLQSTVLICEKMKDDHIIKFSEGLGEYIDNLQAEMREYKNKVSYHDRKNYAILVFAEE